MQIFFSKLKPDYVVSFAGWNEQQHVTFIKNWKFVHILWKMGELGP